jgi:hypothetical protein
VGECVLFMLEPVLFCSLSTFPPFLRHRFLMSLCCLVFACLSACLSVCLPAFHFASLPLCVWDDEGVRVLLYVSVSQLIDLYV